MRKLAWAAGAFSAAIFAANYITAGGWLIPSAALLLLCGIALALLRRRWLRAAVIFCFASALGLGCFSLHELFTTAQARRLSGETRDFTAVVLDYPEAYDEYTRTEIRLDTEEGLPLRALLYDRSGEMLRAEPGDTLRGSAKLSAADERYGQRYDAYNARDVYLLASAKTLVVESAARRPLRSALMRLNRALTDRIEALFSKDVSPFFQALMLGEKGKLYRDDALYVAMSRAGIMHIVAVSGMHVAFLVGLLQLLLGAGKRSSLLCIALVWAFVLLTGGSPSALRAAFMQTTLLLAPLFGRENDPPTSLLTALAVLLLINPRAASSVSLQLSFASVAGLLLFAPRLYRALSPGKRRGPLAALWRYLAGSLASSLSVLLLTIPLIALYFGSVPLLSPVTNALVLWLVPLCFGGGYLTCLLSILHVSLAKAFAWLLGWPARGVVLVSKAVSAIPFSSVYLSDELILYWLILTYALIGIAFLNKGDRRLRVLLPTGISVLALCFALTATKLYYRTGTGTISVLDVGQGQSIAVMAKDKTLVIDCGNTYSTDNAGDVTGQYLLGCGRTRVDLLVLTHLHADHADGVLRLMELLPVEEVLMPEEPNDEDGLLEPILLAAERHGTRIRFLSRDETRALGGIDMALFAPAEAGDANERCMTAKISLGSYDMLVTADVDKAAERALLASHELHDLELLIVGHHGSRYASSGELLGSIGADTAVISVGYNGYGHPTYETLERLAAYGYTIYRTDLNGTVEVRLR